MLVVEELHREVNVLDEQANGIVCLACLRANHKAHLGISAGNNAQLSARAERLECGAVADHQDREWQNASQESKSEQACPAWCQEGQFNHDRHLCLTLT